MNQEQSVILSVNDLVVAFERSSEEGFVDGSVLLRNG